MDHIKLPPIEIEDVKSLLTQFHAFDTNDDMQFKENSFFVTLNKQIPSVLSVNLDRISATTILNRLLTHYNIPPGNIIRFNHYKGEEDYQWLIFLNRNLFVEIGEEYFAKVEIYYPYGGHTGFVKAILDIIKVLKSARKKIEDNFYLILFKETDGGKELVAKHFQLKPFDISIKDNYNDDFLPVHKRIVERLNTRDDKGVVLLHGAPGTGKTTYIRHLTRTLNKEIIYIPPQYSTDLTSSQFMDLMLKHTNAVLIIEDAENLIEDRNQGRNVSISGLLNIADGLLSFCLKLQIICTFNTNLSRIDPALLRKGRLIALYEFTALETEKARQLAQKLDLNITIDKPMTLAEIYNHSNRSSDYQPRVVEGFKRQNLH